jgi:hypothetical protein
MDEDKTLKENLSDAHSPAEFWLAEIADSKKFFKKWNERSDEVEKVYRGDNDPGKEKFNILWANTETLRPIMYSRTPKPQIERRFKEEEDNVTARLAAEVLERCAEYCIQIEGHEFDVVMERNVLDSLLSGRIISRIVYEPFFKTGNDTLRELTAEEVLGIGTSGEEIPGLEGDQVRTPGEETKEWEEAYIKYVYRRDFLHSRAKGWEDVWWAAFGADLDKDELVEQFGAEIAGNINVSTVSGEEASKEREKTGEEGHRERKTVRVWEIWNKRDLEVIFVAEDNKIILKREKDPLELETFFPCPRPVFTVYTNDSLVPVPEYTIYQYQAEELNILTRRITRLTAALKVKGIYDSDIKELKGLLKGEENELIPSSSFGKLAQAGGVEGAVAWMPIANIGDTISKLIALRQDTIRTIYEITGIADILRGASDPRETATAQRIKGQYGAMRIRKRQKEVQRYARDLIRLLTEVIAEQFSSKTLMVMSGIEQRQFEGTGMDQVVEMLRNDALRGFRIDIETDSTIVEDEEREKKEVMEFMMASSQFMGASFQAVKSGMMPPEVAQEIMLFASRRFRAGRKLEGALMKIGQQPPQDKEKEGKQAELQAKTQIEMAKLQQKDSQFKQEIELEMGKLKVKMMEIKDKKVIAQMKVQADIYQAMINKKTVEINARGGAN